MRGIKYLHSLPQWQQGAFSPLSIPENILNKLGNPQDNIKTIHVAGTNGKGTTSFAISSLLIANRKKTGFFSSPHLLCFTERCRINNQAISMEMFDYYLSKVADICNWDSRAMTYFVATACASFLCFSEEQVDYAVIEVGLGGKFDATNLISNPELAIITSIDFDHLDLLGPGIKEVAENKAGIIKTKSKVLFGNLRAESFEVVEKIAKEKQASIFISEPIIFKPKTELMKSAYGKAAAELAKTAMQILNLSCDLEILENLNWPGRLQYFENTEFGNILIDGAHNSAGVKALLSHIEKVVLREKFQKVTIYLGLKQRAGWEQTANEFKKAKNCELKIVNWDQGIENLDNFFDNVPYIEIEQALLEKSSGLKVFTGSLYLIAQVLKQLS